VEDVREVGGLWFKVLAAEYGEESGRVKGGEGDVSICWKDLNAIREESRLAKRNGLTRILRRKSVVLEG
jgi:hypothetical protein